MTTASSADWNQRYAARQTPWDSGVASKELIRTLDEAGIAPCRAVELGCGTGTNSIYLAQRGFDVMGLDFSAEAIRRAADKAAQAGVRVAFLEADVCRFKEAVAPVDFLFDRGCYHSVRRTGIAGYLRTLERLSHPGTRFLLLAGNANEQTEGPPRVYEHEIRVDLEGLFQIDVLREFRFEVPDPPQGFLAWSCLMTRRPA